MPENLKFIKLSKDKFFTREVWLLLTSQILILHTKRAAS